MVSEIRGIGFEPVTADVADKKVYKVRGHILAQDIWLKGDFPQIGEGLDGWTGHETYIRLHNIAPEGMPPRMIPALDVKENDNSKTIWTKSHVAEGKRINGWRGVEYVVYLNKTVTSEGVEFHAHRGMIS